MAPPWAVTICRTMTNPMPVPSFLVVIKGSKASTSRGMPTPVSLISRTTVFLGRARFDGDLPTPRHRFHRVFEQVEQHLLDLVAVYLDGGPAFPCYRRGHRFHVHDRAIQTSSLLSVDPARQPGFQR